MYGVEGTLTIKDVLPVKDLRCGVHKVSEGLAGLLVVNRGTKSHLDHVREILLIARSKLRAYISIFFLPPLHPFFYSFFYLAT